MRISFARVWAFVTMVLLAVVVSGSSARADGAESLHISDDSSVVSAPRDEPLVLQASAVKIPAIPAGYTQKNLGWLLLSYPASADERMASVVHNADAIKNELQTTLGQTVLSHVEVRIARNAQDMAALAPPEVPPPAYATGVAYSSLHLVIIAMSGPGPAGDGTDVEEVFRHELAHVALEDATLGHHVPRWFNEGFAIHASGESTFLRWKTLQDATLSKKILPLNELDQGFPSDNYNVSIAYAESADFVRFLVRHSDQKRFNSLIERVRTGTSFDRAMGDAYSTNLRKLEFEWREDLSKRFTLTPVLLGGSLLWVLLAGVMVMAYVKKRRLAKDTLARWEREEHAMDVAHARALKAELEREQLADIAASGDRSTLRAVSGLTKIQHEGDWHTLH
ncbi:MAG: peptidase MA family metallohydrolase [Polyangiaceae bacterium]